nr:hypothetical protein [Halorubrum sp. SD612]
MNVEVLDGQLRVAAELVVGPLVAGLLDGLAGRRGGRAAVGRRAVVGRCGLGLSLFGRLAELAEYIDSDTVHETVDRCPSKVQ